MGGLVGWLVGGWVVGCEGGWGGWVGWVGGVGGWVGGWQSGMTGVGQHP